MKKDRFIEYLEENNCSKANLEPSGFAMWVHFLIIYVIVRMFDIEWLFGLVGIFVIFFCLCVAYSFYIGVKKRSIDKKTRMFCGNCGKRFNEKTLAYAVLENECQNCHNEIYET